jgi:hypothetical protein
MQRASTINFPSRPERILKKYITILNEELAWWKKWKSQRQREAEEEGS